MNESLQTIFFPNKLQQFIILFAKYNGRFYGNEVVLKSKEPTHTIIHRSKVYSLIDGLVNEKILTSDGQEDEKKFFKLTEKGYKIAEFIISIQSK